MDADAVPDQAQAENQVTRGLRQLLAVAEDYPDLKANENFLALQEELTGTESKIAYARQFYNDQVMRLNTLIGSFPSNLVAKRVRLRTASSSTSRTRRADRRWSTSRASVYEQIAANKRKTFLLIFGAIVLLGAVGYVLGLLYASGPYGLVGAVALAIVLSFTSYFAGDRIVLASTRAKQVTPQEQPRLHNIVEGLSIAAGIPPRVYVIPERAPNAFATGRNPEHSSVAVTEGLLETMNRVELEGVIGHELAHVVDRDILVGTIVATLVGAIVLISEFFMRSWWWGGFRGRRGGDRSGGGRGDHLRDRARPVGARTDRRADHPARGVEAARVPRRRAGRDAHPLPAGARERAPQDRRRVGDPDALGEQRDRAPVAQPAVADPGRGDGAAREAVQHPPADRRTHPAPRGDVNRPAVRVG